MATSQNGYPVFFTARTTGPLPRLRRWSLPGTDRSFIVRDGSAGFLLVCVALQWHRLVDPLTGGILDEWSWAVRPVRGQTSGYSNHASGTAVDLDATQFPRGIRAEDRLTPTQIGTVRGIVGSYDGCIRWGGDYTSTPDAMHFEINRSLNPVQRVAARMLASDIGAEVLAANPGAEAVIRDGNPWILPETPPRPPARVPKLAKRGPKQHRLGTLNVHKVGGTKAHRVIRALNRTDCDIAVFQEARRASLLAFQLHPRWTVVRAKTNNPGRRGWMGNAAAVRRNAFEVRGTRSVEVARPGGGDPLYLVEVHVESKRVPGARLVVIGNHMPHAKYEPGTFRATRATGLALMRSRADLYRAQGDAVIVAGDTNDRSAADTYADALGLEHAAGDRVDQIHGAGVKFRHARTIRRGVLGRITDHALVLVTFRLPAPAPVEPEPEPIDPPATEKRK